MVGRDERDGSTRRRHADQCDHGGREGVAGPAGEAPARLVVTILHSQPAAPCRRERGPMQVGAGTP